MRHSLDLTTSRAARLLTPLFALTLLLSALLLFWVQPMFTKLILPLYGGSPAVWTSALMFFQLALLAGYCYAHFLARVLSFKHQVALHLVLLITVALNLPIHLDQRWIANVSLSPIVSVLLVLTLSVGLLFFSLAATAPLLQRWFSYTRHTKADNPYFLYSMSNFGSILALAGYPTVIELWLGLKQQIISWALGYVLLTGMLFLCAMTAWRLFIPPSSANPAQVIPIDTPSWRQRAHWILLAFAPSSLLLGVTQHITSEIAAVPLLWMIPLLLYMSTFAIAFARHPLLPQRWILRVQPWFAILLALVWVLNNYISVFVVHLIVFFVTAMMCHGDLVRRRPGATRLTEFYLCIAIGGALGGIFNAVIAPQLFNTLAEYPLAISLACMLRPPPAGEPLFRPTDLLIPCGLAIVYTIAILIGFHPLQHGWFSIVLYLEIIGVALYVAYPRPIGFGLSIAIALLTSSLLQDPEHVIVRQRSFFGLHTVLLDQSGEFHVLMHGLTIHGAEHIDPRRRDEPTTYYHRDGPLGQLFRVTESRQFHRVAVIGLGAGTVACYRKPAQQWTFYELDPVVVQLAQDTRYFHFLEDCAPHEKIIIGDGRLSLQQAPDAYYDLIIIDAFSSDAIPVHMVTREAFALYLRKLSPDGILMLHITNQYLDLKPVIGNLAADARLAVMIPGPHLSLPPEDRFSAMESVWVALARQSQLLKKLATEEGWEPLAPSGARLWSDDYSNIFGALR